MKFSIHTTPINSSPKHGISDDIGKAITYFNEYLKNRMDFLADIATSKVSSLENPMKFYQEVIKGIHKNKILLDRISGINGDVKFTFELLLDNVSIERNNDFYVSMPNDVLGCHAFYIIIENIIRNVCKHAKKDKLYFKLCINITESENFSSYYKVEIYPKFYSTFSGGNFSELQVDNTVDLDSLKALLNSYINQSILDQSNVLRDRALGTIEMDICSAYLRKRDIADVQKDDNEVSEERGFINKDGTPNFLHVTTKEVNENQYSQKVLVQNFYLRKPRQILVIDSNNILKLDEKAKKLLYNDGIWILKQESYKPENIFPHEILVYLDNEGFDDFIKNNKNGLPLRILNKIDIKNIPKNNNNRDFELFMWNAYVSEKDFNTEIVTEINSLSQSSNKNLVFMDDHWYKFDEAKNKNCYYEMGCNHHRAKIIRENIKESNNDISILKHKYNENVNTKIVLFDERIQSNIIHRPIIEENTYYSCNTENYKGSMFGNSVDLYQYFLQQNLIIPNYGEADLNESNFGKMEVVGSVSNNISKFLKLQSADFIVIHLGILEKMLPEKEGENKECNQIESLLLNDLKLDIDKVIITSGRGYPKGLPNNIKFVPLSSIQNAVESVNDKFLLTQILYNARRYKG
jgi:hypothetical protein